MANKTFDGERALVFARGLYHVAACDGLAASERSALKVVARALGLRYDDLVALAGDGLDFAEAARVLDSTWLRRTFVQACRIMAQIDGEISGAERDTLRAAAKALGVGERLALNDLEGTRPDPKDLIAWIGARQVDYISWDDEVRPGWFYPFPHRDHQLAAGAEIIVEYGQSLLVRGDDVVLDVLGPETYTLSPAVLPKLSAAKDWTAGSVQAPLLFVRTGPSPILRWGTAAPVQLEASLGPIPVQVYGRFSLRVCDPGAFASRFARPHAPGTEALNARVRRIISGRFAQALAGLDWADDQALFALIEDLDAVRDATLPVMQAALASAGLSLARFEIEHLTAPLELGLQPKSKRTRTLTKVAAHLVDVTTPPDTAPVPQVRPVRGSRPPRTITDSARRPCVNCAVPVPIDARFCSHCGSAQQTPCAQCGHRLPRGARFCSSCGTAQG